VQQRFSIPRRERRGQATTEWIVLVAVLVVGVVAAGYAVTRTFGMDMGSLGQRAGTVYTTGNVAR
jgi:hypothetical protein